MAKRSMREGISDSLRQHDVSGKPRQSRTSRAYARHFEGYVETSVVRPNGKIKIERIYAGDYYCQDLKMWQRVLLRVGYILLLTMAVLLYFGNGTYNLYCNQVWYVTAFQFVTMGCLIWTLYSLAEYVFSIGQLTVGEYKSVTVKLHKAPYFAAVGVILTMFASGCCFLLVPAEQPENWLYFLLGYAAAGIMLALIPTIDKCIRYNITPSEGKLQNLKREDEDE